MKSLSYEEKLQRMEYLQAILASPHLHSKATREEALRELRPLERELKPEAESYTPSYNRGKLATYTR